MPKPAMTPAQIAAAVLAIADQLDRLWDQLQPAHLAVSDWRESDDTSRDWRHLDVLTDDASWAIANAKNLLAHVAKRLSK